MNKPIDFSNNIDKLRLKLDYENYKKDMNDEFSYDKNNAYDNGDLQPIKQNMQSVMLPELDLSSLTGTNINSNIIEAKNTNSNYQSENVDNDDYQNKGGSSQVQKATEKTMNAMGSAVSGESDAAPFGSINGEGSGFMNNLGSIAGFATEQVNMFSNEAQSEKESWSSFGSSIAGGASVGAMVGGPWGAAIGAAVGLITGTVDMIVDTKKRNHRDRERYGETLRLAEEKRKQDYMLQKGEESVNKLTQLRKAQLNYINLDY